MSVLYLISFPGTDLRLECNNSNPKACAGIEVHCGYSVEPSCALQYANDWQCVGSLNLTNGCPVAALSCAIDLSLFGLHCNEDIVLRCDDGCDSCNFTLDNNGWFICGTLECLSNVPCFLQSNYGDLGYITVNGSRASALTVLINNTFGPGLITFYAPANRGDFRFEAAKSIEVMKGAEIHAVNTGVVDITIHSDGVNEDTFPELRSLFVFASTANELNIWLGEDVRYAKDEDSFIQCPKNGKCKWQSNAIYLRSKYDLLSVVNLILFPGTDLQMVCDNSNSLACDGIEVHCGYSVEPSCDLQYASDWQCVGTLNLTNGCPAALSCAIDLSLIGDCMYQTAQCDDGCDSCKFYLTNYFFRFGSLECLPNVPCFVHVSADSYPSVMRETTVNGSKASALTVYTNHTTTYPWILAVFYAPANRGNFRFEANGYAIYALYKSTLYAENSGVVDIVIHNDGFDSLIVYASTAEELNFWLGEDTEYMKGDIECPVHGKCVWQSKAQPYIFSNVSKLVNMNAYAATDLQLLCDNSLACAGIVVHCNDSADTCEMQYDSDWQCVGALNLHYEDTEDAWQCPVWASTRKPTTTAPKPTTSTTTPTSTTQTPPSTTETPTSTAAESASKSDGFLVYGLVLGVLALFCLAAAFYYYYYRFAAKGKATAKVSSDENYEVLDDSVSLEIAEMRNNGYSSL